MQIRRVLYIDDDEDLLSLVSMVLEACAGWEVVTATEGIEGIVLARARQPDVILLDASMPDMDGITTLTHLREHDRTATIPVVFVTGCAVDLAPGDARGPVGIIAKPFDPMTLAARIEDVVTKLRALC
ncbi:MAG: response regulator [Nannocystaceae bacterium]|nr:response regulator [Myxococcales bacterium]